MNPITVGLLIRDKALSTETESVLQRLPVRKVLDNNELGDWGILAEQIDYLKPDVIIVDVVNLNEPVADLVSRIRATQARPDVIVLNNALAPDVVLASMRAGAGEYLYPPLEQGLQAALEKIGSERKSASGSDANKAIGVMSVKGGCGGTTVCCHLASELARVSKQQTLVADFDLNGGLVGFLLGAKSDYSIVDVVRNLYRLDLSYWKGVVSNGRPGLSVVRAPSTTVRGDPPNSAELRQVVRFAKSLYPWTIVDLGSGLRTSTIDLLPELNEIYLVLTFEIAVLHRAKQAVRELLATGVGQDRLKLILNRVPKSPELTVGELEKMLGLPVYRSIPNDYPTLYEAYSSGALAPANSKLGKNFSDLARSVAGIEAQETKSRFKLFG